MSTLLGFLIFCLTVSLLVNVRQGYLLRERDMTIQLLRDHGSHI